MRSISPAFPRWLAFIFIPFLAKGATVAGCNGLAVTVSSSGNYWVTVPGPDWSFAGTIGQAPMGLAIQQGSDSTGGAYNEISFDFYSGAWRHGAIRAYTESRVRDE
jgi:hypothetical protein